MRNKKARELRKFAISQMTEKIKKTSGKYFNFPEGTDSIICPYKNFIRLVKKFYVRNKNAK